MLITTYFDRKLKNEEVKDALLCRPPESFDSPSLWDFAGFAVDIPPKGNSALQSI